jgi:peptidoglycan hydrolase-like protein with peptidoglycan-binding domain
MPGSHPSLARILSARILATNELGYNAGSPDGLMGRGTRAAIIAFQQDNDLTPDGHPGADLLVKLNSAETAISIISSPNRVESSSQNITPPKRSAPAALPLQSIQTSLTTRDAENFQTCISGDYPTQCKHSLLTSEEAVRVAEAEHRARSR